MINDPHGQSRPVRQAGRYLRITRLCGIGAILIGIAGLLGWIFEQAILNSIVPGLKPIAISASLVFITLGLLEWAAGRSQLTRRTALLLFIPAALMVVFGVLEVITLVTGLPVSIEDAILKRSPALFQNSQTHIAPAASVLVLLIVAPLPSGGA